GPLSPVIVLPASAQTWDGDRLRHVLLHEMAHILRRDLVGHSMARLACAVYWFHPVVWVAARRLRAESERACDDLVLDSGVRPSDYAQHLLDLVITLGNGTAAPSAALPIVRPNEFEGRLTAILDRTIRHGTVGRARLGAFTGLLGVVILSIGAVVPVPRMAPTVTRTTETVSVGPRDA